MISKALGLLIFIVTIISFQALFPRNRHFFIFIFFRMPEIFEHIFFKKVNEQKNCRQIRKLGRRKSGEESIRKPILFPMLNRIARTICSSKQ